MNTVKYIEEMLEKQDELNIFTNGDKWKYGITKEGKLTTWGRYIRMETCELIESFPYKHWKDLDAEPDWDNARMELVDIWHFVLSYILSENIEESKTDKAARISKIHAANISLVELAYKIGDREEILTAADELIRSTFYINPYQMVKKMIILQTLLGMSMKQVHDLYMIKNFLNEFRQDNGYKDGTYVKTFPVNIGGEDLVMEDNALIVRLTESKGDVTKAIREFRELYLSKISNSIQVNL